MLNKSEMLDLDRAEQGEKIRCYSRPCRTVPSPNRNGKYNGKGHLDPRYHVGHGERAKCYLRLPEQLPQLLPIVGRLNGKTGIRNADDGNRTEKGNYYFYPSYTGILLSCIHSTMSNEELQYVTRVLKRAPEVNELDWSWSPKEGVIVTILWRPNVSLQSANSIIESHIPDTEYRIIC